MADFKMPPLTHVVTAAQWESQQRTTIVATIDGDTMLVPNDPANAQRQAIKAQWEDKGKAIAAAPEAAKK